MSARKKTTLRSLSKILYCHGNAVTRNDCVKLALTLLCLSPINAIFAGEPAQTAPVITHTLAHETLAKQLGWVDSAENYCGGYYLEAPFIYPVDVEKKNSVEITSNQTLFSQRTTSVLEGKVTVTREGQQITANKAYIYRDPATGKLSSMEMIGNVHLREPNTLIVGKQAHYNFISKSKSLIDVLYRTTLNGRQIAGPTNVAHTETQKPRKVTGLTAWGKAYEISQTEPRIYELSRASFSTCPPENPAWRLKASHIVLNKNSGRGYATNVRLLVKDVPVFYSPYVNFPIDKQRKSGFLWPTFGGSGKWGPYVLAPYYWNIAPNYDMTITGGLLTKRGVQVSDNFRYLTTTSSGNFIVNVLPNDQVFMNDQRAAQDLYGTNPNILNQPISVTQAELNRLENASPTRKSLIWRDHSQFNDHWSSNVDYNYASDDYYMRDFGNNLNEVMQNQLLQEGDLYFKSQNWNFTGRIQNYETLHPINVKVNAANQYRRFPQLILNGDYPDQIFGLGYFVNSEVTHFDIRPDPGSNTLLPIGNRANLQPGLNLPLYWRSFYINPRAQVALTQYQLTQTQQTNTPGSIKRAVPILDIASGLAFSREGTFLGYAFEQTLEPQIYYTYIPYRNQSEIPIFDTTVNALQYDQLFNYNRFSGIDRIGDANQVGVGVASRLIDQESGFEKARMGVGEIVYFANRLVTLCNSPSQCTDNPTNHANYQRLSPLSALLQYNVNPAWSLNSTALWNPVSKQINNTSLALHYQPQPDKLVNLGYSFARNGDYLSGVVTNNAENNLKLSDFSFAWPVVENWSAVGRWTEDWNSLHFQTIIYGLQYDSCCWAVRLVGGRTFTNLSEYGSPQYTSQYYIQFALKGLGNVGSGNPKSLLSSISGYNPQFGQEI